MLTDKNGAILGQRNILRRFGNGLQWNPADELCVMTEVKFEPILEGNSWTLRGKFFSVERK